MPGRASPPAIPKAELSTNHRDWLAPGADVLGDKSSAQAPDSAGAHHNHIMHPLKGLEHGRYTSMKAALGAPSHNNIKD